MIASIKSPAFVIASLLLASSSSMIFGMNDNQLCFYLNGNRQIESYSAHGDMAFYVKPEIFEGEDIVNVLPLSEITKEEILKKFNEATKHNLITEANYKLENDEYNAEITPLNNQKDISYFVKIMKK